LLSTLLNVHFVPLLNQNQALTMSPPPDPATATGTLSLQNRISNGAPSQNFKLVPCSPTAYFIEPSTDSRFIIEVSKLAMNFK